MYTAITMAASVALIAAVRRQSWSASWMPAIVAAAALVAYIGGQYLDGVAPSLALDYWRGFVLAVGGQQALHRMVQRTPWFQALEQIGNPRGLAAQPRVGDETWM